MRDPNPDMTRRSKYLNRQLHTWSYDALKRLFDGDRDFALYMTEADHEAVFFHAHGRFWLFCRPPVGGWDQAMPELVEDWIGSTAPKEPKVEPVLMHREELPARAGDVVQNVVDDPPEHAVDELNRWMEAWD